MKTDDFDFELQEDRIAQIPIKNRDQSKLLVLGRNTGSIEHKLFYEILDYLKTGDALVLNDTKVLPARLYGNRPGKEERIEVLLLKRNGDQWEALVRPGKKMRLGSQIEFGQGILKGKVIGITEEGTRIIDFDYDGIFEEILDQLGEMPLPPYIKEKLENKDRYQTIYAREPGSAAAPTAGLHFTKDLLDEIKKKGVEIVTVTLHVGLGTFRPVKVEDVEKHKMHSEYYILDESNADKLNKVMDQGGDIVAVGTTSVRTLETIGQKFGKIRPDHGFTNIFIYPGFHFKVVDSLVTNFHLPKSTLMMLVSAFSSKEKIMRAYQEAIDKDYLFFSFGDGMLIRKD